ncbi:carbohydrate ABC transporter substrate-binding protein, partial [Myceligenerans sp. I2]|nr:carbohydrate ABC transporter substrate-binding protein [Myceligenerans indicum]
MRINKKSAAVAASVAALGMTLAACGSGGGSDDAGSEGGADQVEVFTWWAAGSEKAGLDALVGVFNEQHPDIEFVNGAVAGGAGSAAKDLLQTRLQAQDPP